ncbi:MAG: fatty acid--CoA ligase [Desulfobacterales bacterium]|nr:fatty acid--CoA ligase [Desulfobacterales bacterium]
MATRRIEPTPSAYYYPLLIKNLLQSPLNYAPGQEIIYRDQMRYDYLTFQKRLSQLANALKKLGVQQGDTVAVMDWDSHRYLECFFAIPMMGAVLHMVNIRFSPEQILYTINHAKDDILIINTDFLPILKAFRDQIKTVKKIILIKEGGTLPEMTFTGDGEYEDLIGQSSSEYEFADFDENSIATTFYTSGTTGEPKGVYFSHRQLVLHTYGLMSGLCAFNLKDPLNPSDVYMPLTPMFQAHSWGIPYLATMLGVKQVYPGPWESETLLKLIDAEKVTFSHCVPTILHMLLNSPAAENINFSKWKVLIGGAGLHRKLCKQAFDNGINLYTGYGMSETCPILTISNLKPHMIDWDINKQAEIGCRAGLALPLVHLEVVDIEGQAVPHDDKSTGEIIVRAPWNTLGYVSDPEASASLWKEGWLHTGDIGHIDTEGYLEVTDRMKDIIKTGGEWIASLKLEDIITQHDAVLDAAVIGVPDEKWGERPLALLVLRDEYRGKLEEDDFKKFYMKYVDNGTIPKHSVPDKIIIVDSIAKNCVGKISKKHLREQYK